MSPKMKYSRTRSIGNEAYDGRFEVIDDFIDSLPLGEGGRVDRRSDDSLEDRKTREEGDSKSRKSHDVRLLYWLKW
jgi:hypothetical protein